VLPASRAAGNSVGGRKLFDHIYNISVSTWTQGASGTQYSHSLLPKATETGLGLGGGPGAGAGRAGAGGKGSTS
jgi:hypothetical protein